MKNYKTVTCATLVLLSGIYSPLLAQSGRARRSTPKPATPVESPSPSPAVVEKPKPELPKIVDGEPVYVGEELDSKAIIKKKPPPEYSTKAEVRGIQGKVLLRAILSASGAVTHIEVVRGLPYGLNEKAIEAARLIRFIPAMKDGKPASEWVELEYNFFLF